MLEDERAFSELELFSIELELEIEEELLGVVLEEERSAELELAMELELLSSELEDDAS